MDTFRALHTDNNKTAKSSKYKYHKLGENTESSQDDVQEIGQNSKCVTLTKTYNWKILGSIMVAVILIILVVTFVSPSESCNMFPKSFWQFWSAPNKNVTSSTPNLNSTAEDSHTIKSLLKDIRNKIMSFVLKSTVYLVLQSETTSFTCPNKEEGAYPDKINCKKYYVCSSGKYNETYCGLGLAFDPASKTCTNANDIELCNRIEMFPNYNCTSVGLHPFSGDCNRFVVCNRARTAFIGNCHQGDFFHPKYLICLPSSEVGC